MRRVYVNSLFFRIVITVVLGIICLVTLLSAFHINLSKKVFIENFSKSQDKIFTQIDAEFYEFYEDVAGILQNVSSNPMVIQYMRGIYQDYVEEWQTIQGMSDAINNTELTDHHELGLLLAGNNGRTYIHSSPDRLAVDEDSILDTPFFRKVEKNPRMLESTYLESGYTDTVKNEPVIIFAKAIGERGSEATDGVALLTIKEADFRKLYGAFVSQTSNIMIFNRNNELLSASGERDFEDENQAKAKGILQEMEQKNVKKMNREQGSSVKSYQIQKFQNTSYKMLGIIDPNAAFDEEYHLLTVILLTFGIGALVVLMIFYLVRTQTRPLYKLADTMRSVGKGKLDAYVEVQGTDEVKELSRTYNAMITELNHYIQRLLKMQEEKRRVEIYALQMQINPHYMYNTLTSIKWLIWQGNTEKSTQVIDAFISLLRNTISNTAEFITMEQEIENLKNYVLINETRYGDNIRTEFYVSPVCSQIKVPKLILQPFVENAFFHAFPEGRSGIIQIFVKEKEGLLWVEITDNGVGLTSEKLISVRKKERRKGEHFTGIGINNVDDRIKMIYGKEYGIHINSVKDQGTTVTIQLPIK